MEDKFNTDCNWTIIKDTFSAFENHKWVWGLGFDGRHAFPDRGPFSLISVISPRMHHEFYCLILHFKCKTLFDHLFIFMDIFLFIFLIIRMICFWGCLSSVCIFYNILSYFLRRSFHLECCFMDTIIFKSIYILSIIMFPILTCSGWLKFCPLFYLVPW